jgi:predicted  nucleic acid-binding Zn-ribbon protein
MSLKNDLAELYQLQLKETNLARTRAELAGLNDGARVARRAHVARTTAEQAAQALREAEGQLKDRELALEGTETDRAAKVTRAFGGTVTDNKELAMLGRKLEELDRRKAKLEEEILVLYDGVDQLRQEEAAARQQASELAQRARRQRAEYQTRSQELQAAVEQLATEREALAAAIPASLLAQYEKQRDKNQGVGVAVITGGTCGFCRTRTPNELVVLARNGIQLVRCESCSSILVIE